MSNRISGVLMLVLALGTVTGFGLYLQTSNQNTLLQTRITTLESDVQSLNVEITVLEDSLDEHEVEYQQLSDEYDETSNQLRSLQTEHNELTYQYSRLDRSYSTLEDTYEQIQDIYELSTSLRVGNSLESYYDALRYEFGPTGSTSYRNYDKETCTFSAQLALHDLHRLSWIDMEELYDEDVGLSSYAQAKEILDAAMDYCELDSWDSDVVKIEKILAFITWYIDYEAEIDDSQMSPVETLSMRSGDCDDFAVLAAAMFEDAGIDSAIAFFTNEEGEGHAMTLVHLDDLDSYDCWYYTDLTDYDLQEGNWVLIEPQLPISYQESDELGEYDLYITVELDYDKVS